MKLAEPRLVVTSNSRPGPDMLTPAELALLRRETALADAAAKKFFANRLKSKIVGSNRGGEGEP